MSELCFIYTTLEDEQRAQRMARELVEEKLAACVHREPPVTSTYRWEGQVEETREIRLLIKTAENRSDEVFRWLRRNHPYDCPEIVQVSVQKSDHAYEEWVRKNTS